MPIDPQSETVITALDDVPEGAEGMARDIRVRWACEEIGRDYRTELFGRADEKPAGYLKWQPFGQIPAFAEGDMRIFESGAMLLYLGEQDERLLPRDPKVRWPAISWLMSGLNSIEPAMMQLVWIDFFNAGQDWSAAARPAAVEFAKRRLASLSDSLGDAEWLAGPFTIADLFMVTVLRNLRRTDLVEDFPNLVAYRDRGEARAAFQQALSDQIADYNKTRNARG